MDNKILVSEGKTNVGEVLGVSFFVLIFLFLYTQAIVVASWVGATFSLMGLVIFINILFSFLNKVYYFSEKNIVIAESNNDFMGEINYADSTVFWNEYFEVSKWGKNYFLIAVSGDKKIVISQKRYKNYDEIVNYFNCSGLPKDSTLRDVYFSGQNEFYSKLENRILMFSLLLFLLLLITFGFIVSDKKETGTEMYFTGKIKKITITHGRNRSHYLQLYNYPTFEFNLKYSEDIALFDKYNYYDGNKIYTNLNKKIRIGISKDEYDWKTKNKLIRCLNVIDKNRWDIEEYKMLE